MRIVAGEFKGRAIKSPDESTTRPTTDRVRESMFSSLYSRLPRFEGIRVLDAFAGSGALGIEALSRGADACLFGEKDARARRVLMDNLASIGLSRPRAVVRAGNILEAGSSLCSEGPFSLVLLDPPYAMPATQVAGFLEELADVGGLCDGAVIVYEHAADRFKDVIAAFSPPHPVGMDGQKKYGNIGVSYLTYPSDASSSEEC